MRVVEVKISFINNTSNIYDEMMYYNLTDAQRAKTGIIPRYMHAKLYMRVKREEYYAKRFRSAYEYINILEIERVDIICVPIYIWKVFHSFAL